MTNRAALGLLIALLFAGCVSTQPADTRQPVDLLVTGGTVLTMAGPDIVTGSVAIAGGSIVAVGPSSEVDARFTAKETIDARGMAVIPGFVNAHTHVPMSLFRGIADDRDLMDWLQNFIFPAEKKNVDAEFVKWGTRLAAAEMIRSGTTTFADMYYFESDIARETKNAGLRAVLGETMLDFPAPDNKTWDEMVAYMRRFAAEYRNDPLITPALAPHAPYTVSPEHLKQVRALATELKLPILIHVSETKDEAKQIAERSGGASPIAYLESLGFLGEDVVAAHCVWLSPEDISILAKRGVGVAHNPQSNMMLASGVAPVLAMRRSGVDVGIGTDGPAGSNNNMDMIEEIASAARLQKVTSGDPKALGARAMLEMATIGGARALGLDDRIGTLETGKRADIAIIDLNTPEIQPVYSVDSAIVYAASAANVDTTIVDGKVLMRHRRILTVDVGETLRRAAEYRAKILGSLAN